MVSQLAFHLPLLLVASGSSEAAGTGPQLRSVPSVLSPDTCRTVRFQGEVSHPSPWQYDLPGRLVFRLAPSADPAVPGWTIELRARDLPEPENELTWVATPPYRFWNPRYLDLSYGLDAREVVRRAVREFTIVHPADRERAAAAVRTLLWPAGRAESELAEAEATVASSRKGRGVFRITDATLEETPDGRGRIDRLRFAVTVCLP